MDDLFTARYLRLFSAVRQWILKDPESPYWPMYRHTLMDFIEEQTGGMPDWKEVLLHVNNHGGSGVGLALLADAIMLEVISLHIHLRPAGRRPEILKSCMEQSMKGGAVDEAKAVRRQ